MYLGPILSTSSQNMQFQFDILVMFIESYLQAHDILTPARMLVQRCATASTAEAVKLLKSRVSTGLLVLVVVVDGTRVALALADDGSCYGRAMQELVPQIGGW